MKKERFSDMFHLRDIYHQRHDIIDKLNNIFLEEGYFDKRVPVIHETFEKQLKESVYLDPRDFVYYYGVYASSNLLGIAILTRDTYFTGYFQCSLTLKDSIERTPFIVAIIKQKIYEVALTLR